jgi:hypothetical protein
MKVFFVRRETGGDDGIPGRQHNSAPPSGLHRSADGFGKSVRRD